MALFAAGLTAVLRSGVAVLSLLIPLLLIVPFIFTDFAPGVGSYLPDRAGQVIIRQYPDGPIGPWTGLGVTALWACARGPGWLDLDQPPGRLKLAPGVSAQTVGAGGDARNGCPTAAPRHRTCCVDRLVALDAWRPPSRGGRRAWRGLPGVRLNCTNAGAWVRSLLARRSPVGSRHSGPMRIASDAPIRNPLPRIMPDRRHAHRCWG